MKRTFTLSRFVATAAIAVVMLLAGQSVRAAVTITALSGTGGTGGEGYPSLVDGKMNTKMGHSCFRDDVAYAYIIIKTSQPIVPTDYFLITGNDTKSDPRRNWQDWTISAANFSSDAEATENAAWTLIDQRTGEVLPSENFAPVDFKFNKADGTTAYQYFYIKITAAANNATDVWLQMSEFGFGVSDAFLNTNPIMYTALEGTRLDDSTESLNKLFDGNDNTKWGTGMDDPSTDWGKDGKPAYAIFKASRPIAPTYYKLVTGTDNAVWTHRNWKDYRIYGIADVPESQLKRNDDRWVLLDDKSVTEETLPDKNSYTVYLSLSEENTTKYQYFKLEVATTQAGAGYMQMSELSLGDAAQFPIDRENTYQARKSDVNMDAVFQKTLKTDYQSYLEKLNAVTSVFDIPQYNDSLLNRISNINASINAYENYAEMVKTLRNHYDNHSCITGASRTIVGNYLNETVAPGDAYPNGSYAYIMDNAVLDVAAVEAETRYVNKMIELYANDLTEGAIECTYTSLSGTETNTSEGPGSLFDHNSETKWCTTNNASVFIVFAASEPIAPTYYKLTTANDTQGNPGRNWKNWKIYGANFDSEEQATRDAEGWQLIDEKSNVGTSQLPAANFTDAYFIMSSPSATKYKYFRIEVEALVNGATQQMADFEFGNDANRIVFRNEKYAELATYDLDVVAQKSLKDDYNTSLENLRSAASIQEINSCVSTLNSLQSKIETSAQNYAVYDSVYNEFVNAASTFGDYEKVNEWADAYINQNEAPNAKFLRGTHTYIWDNCLLDDAGIKAETTYLSGFIAAVQDEETTRFIVLGGQGQWNDNENWSKLVDNDYNTKWGCNISSTNPPYVIFRALDAVNPYFYTLNTGGDTESFPGRNWGTWKIYGANFEGDGEATRDAEGWVLVDEKTNVGQNRLKPTNNTASYFGFSTETTVPYTYYMVVIEKAYNGGGQQMQELHFGTPDEFDVIKDDYRNQAGEFNTDIVCEQRYLDAYDEKLNAIDECVNMEALFRTYDELLNLQDSIALSGNAYANYITVVENLKTFVNENPDVKGESLDKVNGYIGNEAIEPSEDLYPRGSYAYIIDERLLNDSLLDVEIAFVDSLKKMLVSEGYIAGTEITALVSDPSLAKGGEGWSQTSYTHGTYNGMSAGEFCEGKRTYDINQTITGLKDGYYEVRINAAFRPAGDTTSTNYRAIVYANDAQVYAPAVIDEMVSKADAVDGENCYISGNIPDKAIMDEFGTDTLGYVIWGVRGSCIAFKAGRYENVLVAKVTDGKLTIGMKNDGTPDKTNGKGDWSAMGNTRIFYLGAEDNDAVSAAYDRALACQTKRAKVLGEYLADNVNEFKHTPNFSQAERNTLSEAVAAADAATTVAAKQEILATFSALCNQINATKDAYVVANDAATKTYDKWMDNLALTETDKLADDVNGLQDKLLAGDYTAAEAIAAKATLWAAWPDYLKVTNAESMGYVEDEPFSYIITATTNRPYVLANGTYEALDSTKTVLKFEYKSETALTGSRFYFGTPTPVSTQSLECDGFAAQNDWKTVYFYIQPALKNWSFGDLEDVIRFDLGTEVAEGTIINLRHMQYITAEQAAAEGAEYTYPTAISSVDEAKAPVVKGIYNLSGQRVSRTQKGIYVIDGRKVLVK